MKMKYYAVRKGKKTGIFDNWKECEEIFEINIDLEKNKYQEKEIQQLKRQICVQALKLKNRNRG